MSLKNLWLVAAFLGVLCQPVFSEEEQTQPEPGPILPVSSWVIHSNNYFNGFLRYYYQDFFSTNEELDEWMVSYTLPEEIDTNLPWSGITLTDGKEMWSIVFIVMKTNSFIEEPIDISELQSRLLAHPILSSLFENEKPRVILQMDQRHFPGVRAPYSLGARASRVFDRKWSLQQTDEESAGDPDWPWNNSGPEKNVAPTSSPGWKEHYLQASGDFLDSSTQTATKPFLIIASQSLPITRVLDEVQPLEKIAALSERAQIAWLVESPDRILLPTLPPEEENEPPFVKYVRDCRKEKDGKASQPESQFYGINWDNDSWVLVNESIAVEGSEEAKRCEQWIASSKLLPIGGFCEESNGFDLSSRIIPNSLFSSVSKMHVSSGVKLLSPEERDGTTMRYTMNFSFGCRYDNDAEFEEKGTVLSDGILASFYPIQREDIEIEEGLATPETLEKINKTLAENILAMLVEFRDFATSSGGDEPIDIAATSDENGIYFAVAYPPESKPINWTAIRQTVDAVSEMFSIPRLDDEGHVVSEENWQTQIRFSEPETCEGVTYCKFDIHSNNRNNSNPGMTPLFGVYGIGENFFCLAVPQDCNPLTLEKIGYTTEEVASQGETLLAGLKQRVARSRQLLEDDMQLPPTVTRVRGNVDGYRFRFENETVGRKTTYRLKVDPDSLANVYTLARQYGMDVLKSFLPFE